MTSDSGAPVTRHQAVVSARQVVVKVGQILPGNAVQSE